MISSDHPRLMARHSRWANARLYDAVALLDAEDYHADRPAFFGSIHNTLSHILVGDRVWLARITGECTDAPTALDQVLYPDWAACVRRERRRMSASSG